VTGGGQPDSPEVYLSRLREQLKGLPAREQADLLEEIASHLESGEADPHLGAERVMAELGSPEQLGRGLRGVHRPRRLADLLLALLPGILLSPLITAGISALYGPLNAWSPMEAHLYLGGRVAILAAALLALVGKQRRSAELTLFWISGGLGTLLSLMTRERRFIPGQEAIPGTWAESLLWYALLIGLCAWLVSVLARRRFDRLLVVFAVLPLLLAAANYSTGQVLLRGGIAHSPGLVLPFGIFGILAEQAAWAAGLALFFLAPPRDLRWLGLLLVDLYSASPNLSAYRATPVLLLIWSAWVALVLIAWAWDGYARRADHGLRGTAR
jgi:hypothetical protein